MGMSNWSAPIRDFLVGLPHTGHAGFEGLVTRLCEAATGQQFRLSGSGRQQGQDARSEPGTGNRIKIEAKHYDKSNLNLRVLLAEIAEATAPGTSVDLWVLGASCPVMDQHAKSLEEFALDRGVEVLILDRSTEGLERLWVLMAAHHEAVETWAAHHHGGLDMTPVVTALGRVKSDARFETARAALVCKLKGTALGYDDARQRAHVRLRRVLADKGRSTASFNQDLAVLADDARRVNRANISQGLDAWWEASTTTIRRAAVLGEEGTGKTWAAMSWICERLERGGMPIVLPFSAAVEAISATDTIVTLLPRLLLAWTGVGTELLWSRRLSRWVEEGGASGPLILLVADGLNEKASQKWPSFFRSLAAPEWGGKIAVLVTDRPGHWRPNCARSGLVQFQEVEIKGYTDQELSEALGSSGISIDDIPEALLPLIRKPRYCELVIQHFNDMKEHDDFTIERLIYLDTEHRCMSRPDHPLNPDEMTTVIRNLARHYRESPTFELSEISNLIPHSDPSQDIYEEIRSGGLLERQEGSGAKFKVERTRLVFGLGMLLADDVRKHVESGIDSTSIREAIQRWFEPHPDMDLKVEIAGSGLFHALLDSEFSAAGRRELIGYWLGLRNWEDHAQKAFVDYVVRCPADFVAVVEEFWSSEMDRGAAQEFLATAFLKHRDDERVQPALVLAVKRWMGFVHPEGQPLMGHDEERRQTLRNEIAERVGRQLEIGELVVAGERLTVIEDSALLRLSRFGFLIMSGGDRRPFINALVPWAVASAVMGMAFEAEVVNWVVRLSDENIEPSLLAEAERLIERNEPVALKAANILLWRVGTPASKELREDHPAPESVHTAQSREEHRKDPCTSFYAWTDEECARCLDREDVPPHVLIQKAGNRLLDPDFSIPKSLIDRAGDRLPDPMKIRNHMSRSVEDLTLEQSKFLLAAHAPEVIANFARSVVRTMPTREVLGQRMLALVLPEISLILQEPEVNAVLKTLNQLRATAGRWPSLDEERKECEEATAEGFGFLGIFPSLEPDDALSSLLDRPLEALDWLQLQNWFEPLSAESFAESIEHLHSTSEPRTLVRMLWFLSASTPELSEKDVNRVVELACHDDWHVRAAAMQFACLINDNSLCKQIVQLNHNFVDIKPWWEMHWGTHLLMECAGDLPFDDVARRMHPSTAGFLLETRGNKPEEILIYAETLDKVLSRIIGANDPETVTSLPPIRVLDGTNSLDDAYPDFAEDETDSIKLRSFSASWTSGRSEPRFEEFFENFGKDASEEWNRREKERVETIIEAWGSDAFQWYGRRFSHSALNQICRLRPDLVKRWVEPALGQGAEARTDRMRIDSFLAQLSAAVFEHIPALGLALWQAMADQTHGGIVFDAAIPAFEAPDNPETEQARRIVLDAAWDDESLSRIAYFADQFGRQTWTSTTVEELLEAEQLWKRAKALTLASYTCITEEDFDKYVTRAEVENTWLDSQMAFLRDNVRMNLFAQHWYRQFIEADDWDVAWASFELTLKCADRRFYVWRRNYEESSADHIDKKLRFVEARNQRIDRDLKRDKKRQDTLFGIKIERGEILPFTSF